MRDQQDLTLEQLLTAFAEAWNRHDVAPKVRRRLRRFFERSAQISMLFLVDDSAAERSVVLRRSDGIDYFPATYKFGECTTGTVAKTRKSKRLVVDQTTRPGKYDEFIRPHLGLEDGRRASLVAVPVVAQGETRGVMKVINKAAHGEILTEDDLKFCEELADYVGVALGNAKAHDVARSKSEAEKELSLVSQAVAHEVAQTYGMIPGKTGLIDEALVRLLTPKQQELAGPIKDKLTVIAELARQAGDTAEMITGFSAPKNLEIRDINGEINTAIKKIRDLVKSSTEHRTASVIHPALAKIPLWCLIEHRPFEAIVRNLVLNAFQALGTRQDGRVTIATRAGTGDDEASVIITFSDNGPGIDPDFIKTIFNPRVSTKTRGAGLGLWFVRRRLALIGGSIEAASIPGKGATFSVKLPRASKNEVSV